MKYWDMVSSVYDIFEKLYNGKVFDHTGEVVAKEILPDDDVLECACGTGAISVYIAPVCRRLTATDMSVGMLKQTAAKLKKYPNTKIYKADIMHLKCRDDRFDKVVAGNVIHLLDNPVSAVNELVRVCKPGGSVIIPTYFNINKGKLSWMAQLLNKSGADFKRQFDLDSYKAFFDEAGYKNVTYRVAEGKMPCAIAVIEV